MLIFLPVSYQGNSFFEQEKIFPKDFLIFVLKKGLSLLFVLVECLIDLSSEKKLNKPQVSATPCIVLILEKMCLFTLPYICRTLYNKIFSQSKLVKLAAVNVYYVQSRDLYYSVEIDRLDWS